MARPTVLSVDGAKFALLRTVAGAIAADNATLSDANYPVASAFDSTGFDSVFIGVEIDGGSSPTATIELLFRDEDAADQQRWKRLKFGAIEGVVAPGSAPAVQDTGVLTPNADMVELVTLGRRLVYPRVKAVTNAGSTTALRIIAIPGVVRPKRAIRSDDM